MSLDPQLVWGHVVELIKLRVVYPSLWRAMEAAVAIAIEDNRIILGFPGGSYHMAGHLNNPEHRTAILRALKEVTSVSLDFLSIDGSTIDDWNMVKSQEAEKKRMADSSFARLRQQSQQEKAWEKLMEQVQRRFSAMPNRQFPQTKARYLNEIMPAIAETMESLLNEKSELDDINQRQLARVIERAASLSEVPGAYIALEIQRIRSQKHN